MLNINGKLRESEFTRGKLHENHRFDITKMDTLRCNISKIYLLLLSVLRHRCGTECF